MPKGDGKRTHNMYKSPEYLAWQNMKRRCYLKCYGGYKNYGARGISVCDRWINSFENFFKDMGIKPSTIHSLDRINNNGNYEPSNCRWSDKSTQSINRRTLSTNTHPKGVTFRSSCKDRKFAAYITRNYKQKFLGRFFTAEEAHQAYLTASLDFSKSK